MTRIFQLLVLALILIVPSFAADPVSDDSLYDTVRVKLAGDREVGGGKIEVKVTNGVVELSGKVKTDKIRVKAEKIAKKVKGVKSVENKLQVSPL